MPRTAARSITRFITLDVRGGGMDGVGARGRVVSFPSGVLLCFGCRCICLRWVVGDGRSGFHRLDCVCVCVCVCVYCGKVNNFNGRGLEGGSYFGGMYGRGL